jgi:uncharacterized protein with HEPN domain
MEERTVLRLRDIQDAIQQLELIFQSLAFSDFVGDRVVRAASERFLEILSEASRHLPDDLKALHPDVPWKQIADIGNHLRHAYHRIDAEIVWQIHASGQLEELRAAVLAMLSEQSS